MSKFEINKEVSSKFRKVWTWKGEVFLSRTSTKPFDPCSKPEHAFPIMLQHSIAILPTGLNGVWVAIHSPNIDKDNKIHADILEYNENPLVAAMICFLKVMDGKHERQ